MHRVILHCDMNNFYASVECLHNPALRGKPIAVAGDVLARHGIVLAKNYLAKGYGVQTGNPLWLARQLCPEIVFVPPNYDQYLKFSSLAREIYADYTDQVEPFGLDECWLDVTGSQHLFGDGRHIADEMRRRIKLELGITASVGVSFNKVFAKLGSDMKKPDATTVISREEFKSQVWGLPAKDLLYVGHSTAQKLARYGIGTIGQLAQTDHRFLQQRLGKIGLMLWQFANGMDNSPVSQNGSAFTIKSIGNSTTTPRDLTTDQEVQMTLTVLSESVAQRMRACDFLCRTVQLTVRDNRLQSYVRQLRLPQPVCTASEIGAAAMRLYRENPPQFPPRSLGVRACNLLTADAIQLSLFAQARKQIKEEQLERTVDAIRSRFGHFSLQRAIMLTDPQLSSLDPAAEHIIHPVGFLQGAG